MDYGLSPRETEVLQEMVEGLSQREIAETLYISRSTVNSHIQRIYEKLHVNSASAAVAKAVREHLAAAARLFMDETTAPVLDPGRGRTRKGFFWAIASDDRGAVRHTRQVGAKSGHPLHAETGRVHEEVRTGKLFLKPVQRCGSERGAEKPGEVFGLLEAPVEHHNLAVAPKIGSNRSRCAARATVFQSALRWAAGTEAPKATLISTGRAHRRRTP